MNSLVCVMALAGVGGVIACRRWASYVDGRLHRDFRAALLAQADGWVGPLLGLSPGTVESSLAKEIDGGSIDARLRPVLRVEWEVESLDRDRCEVRLLVAVALRGDVRLGTMVSRWRRADLPSTARDEMLVRSDRLASFVLVDRSTSRHARST